MRHHQARTSRLELFPEELPQNVMTAKVQLSTPTWTFTWMGGEKN